MKLLLEHEWRYAHECPESAKVAVFNAFENPNYGIRLSKYESVGGDKVLGLSPERHSFLTEPTGRNDLTEEHIDDKRLFEYTWNR